jgi:hypothetical protein
VRRLRDDLQKINELNLMRRGGGAPFALGFGFAFCLRDGECRHAGGSVYYRHAIDNAIGAHKKQQTIHALQECKELGSRRSRFERPFVCLAGEVRKLKGNIGRRARVPEVDAYMLNPVAIGPGNPPTFGPILRDLLKIAKLATMPRMTSLTGCTVYRPREDAFRARTSPVSNPIGPSC